MAFPSFDGDDICELLAFDSNDGSFDIDMFMSSSAERKVRLLVERLRNEVARNLKLTHELTISRAALDSKRMFVRYVSHEIRTPLNTVSMGLKLLIDTTIEGGFFFESH
jgi:signal transduction histidine kinase